MEDRGSTQTEPAADVGAAPGGHRKLTAKGRATRARIVEAAAELVFARGVAHTGIDDVRRASGASASQLYHYFTDKDDLVRAVIAHQTEGVLDAQRPLLDHLDSFAALRQWCDLLVDLQEQRHCIGGCPIGSIAAELADTNPTAREDLSTSFKRWEAPIRAGLADMRTRGELRPDTDTDALALALLTALQGGLLLTRTHRSTEPVRVALDSMLAHIRTYATQDPSRLDDPPEP